MISHSDRSLSQMAGSRWEIIVVGAGLAGSLAAYLAATAGRRVLLVDSKFFPRDKVCGCCLNERALSLLSAAGLDTLRRQLPGPRLQQIEFLSGSQRVVLPAYGGIAVSRSTLDEALISAAIEAGAVFLPGWSATLLPTSTRELPPGERGIHLKSATQELRISASCIAVADGLNRASLRECKDEFPYHISPASWVGVGAMLPTATDFIVPGRLRMVIGKHGYVGSVQVESNRMSIAAAISAEALRQNGTPFQALATLFQSAGVEVPASFSSARWTGTGPLTRTSTKISGHRVLVLGDATGYVEPITGEGMAWALESAYRAAPLLIEGASKWSESVAAHWEQTFRQSIQRRQSWCIRFSAALRHPYLLGSGLTVARLFPVIPRLIAANMHQSFS